MNEDILKKVLARRQRGETTSLDDDKFHSHTDEELIRLVQDETPQTRTSAAKNLGKRKCFQAIPTLCDRLSKEKSLYSRIATSESLSAIGVKALPPLIQLIGKIGKNQHTKLPSKPFEKWNYPLPRDIVSRTIMKMGPGALPKLQEALFVESTAVMCELIDAIGYISFYSQDYSSLSDLMQVLETNGDDAVIVWKLVRAFSAFRDCETVDLLETFLTEHQLPELRWEAARSLGVIGKPACNEILKRALQGNEENELVLKGINLSLTKIKYGRTY